MGTQRAPHGRRDACGVTLPVSRAPGKPAGGDDRVGDEFLDALAVVDVVVQRHRARAQRTGQRPHGESAQTVAVDDLQRLRLDLTARVPCPHHRPTSVLTRTTYAMIVAIRTMYVLE